MTAASARAPATTIATPAVNPGAEHKPILAERFKTKMCQNFIKHGECPYEARCMFAHGDDDLRSKEMNLQDGLTTEDAIKAFQRAKWAAERAAAENAKKKGKRDAKAKLVPPSPVKPPTPVSVAKPALAKLSPKDLSKPVSAFAAKADNELATPSRTPDTIAAPKSPRAMEESSGMSHSSPMITPTPMKARASMPGSTATTPFASRFRHDPYAPVVVGYPEFAVSPLAAAMMMKRSALHGEPCYCADCAVDLAMMHPHAHELSHPMAADQILLA